MKFAVSSSDPAVTINPAWCVAFAKQQARLAAWHNHEPATVEHAVAVGVTDDPDAYDVHVLPNLNAFPGCEADAAMHTVGPTGRPVCYIAADKCTSLIGKGGVTVAISHEMCESAEDPLCIKVVQGPSGPESFEVCDRVQGWEYEEPGSEGIWLENALGPEAFVLGATRAEGLDIASDVRPPMVTAAFPLSPQGYFNNPETGVNTFGLEVSEEERAEKDKNGPRGRRVGLAGWQEALPPPLKVGDKISEGT